MVPLERAGELHAPSHIPCTGDTSSLRLPNACTMQWRQGPLFCSQIPASFFAVRAPDRVQKFSRRNEGAGEAWGLAIKCQGWLLCKKGGDMVLNETLALKWAPAWREAGGLLSFLSAHPFGPAPQDMNMSSSYFLFSPTRSSSWCGSNLPSLSLKRTPVIGFRSHPKCE